MRQAFTEFKALGRLIGVLSCGAIPVIVVIVIGHFVIKFW